MLGPEVATYLTTAGLGLTFTTSGTVVYGVPFPAEAPDAAVCVIPYGGMESLDAFGPVGSAAIFERPRFQVVCRGITNNQSTVMTLSNNIYKALRHFSGTMGGVTYSFVKALQPPFYLGLDDSQRCMWVTNYQAIKAES